MATRVVGHLRTHLALITQMSQMAVFSQDGTDAKQMRLNIDSLQSINSSVHQARQH